MYLHFIRKTSISFTWHYVVWGNLIFNSKILLFYYTALPESNLDWPTKSKFPSGWNYNEIDVLEEVPEWHCSMQNFHASSRRLITAKRRYYIAHSGPNLIFVTKLGQFKAFLSSVWVGNAGNTALRLHKYVNDFWNDNHGVSFGV